MATSNTRTARATRNATPAKATSNSTTSTTPEATKPEATTTPAPEATPAPRFCGCGCGKAVAGRATYKPGHDARRAGVVGRALAAAQASGNAARLAEAEKALAALSSPLQKKARGVAATASRALAASL